jgi:hypothetical protein
MRLVTTDKVAEIIQIPKGRVWDLARRKISKDMSSKGVGQF